MSAQRERQNTTRDQARIGSSATEQAVARNNARPAIVEHSTPAPSRDVPVVVSTPVVARELLAAASRPTTASQREHAQVRVDPHVLDLVTIPATTPQATQAARGQRDLNEIVHRVLIVGLLISTALMLAGIGLDLVYQRALPTVVPDFGEVFSGLATLRPSSFLALGLLVLIATPILRVIGSIGAFLYERDWRYAGITSVVLLVLIVSLLLGKG